ncbi:MAG: hypothetical protein ABIA76_01375 [Candidatus Diapherotrites archaeon]
MNSQPRIQKIGFAEESIEKAFHKLEKGKHEEKQLFEFLKRAINDLKENPFYGIRIPSKLWPKKYIEKYKINNLRKYNLPNGWRLLYTIKANEIEIISVLIEWLDHKKYEKKFKY